MTAGTSSSLLRLALLLSFAISIPMLAQGAKGEAARAAPRDEFAVWGTSSFSNGHVFGFAQDRQLFLAELRYGRLVLQKSTLAFRYVIAAVPLALVGEPRAGDRGRDYVYGGGFSPIGLQINFRRGRMLQPFLASNGGFLYFTGRLLSPDATRFNFTVDLAGGVQVFSSRRSAFSLGYKYHHLSNANLTDRNPGLDSHSILVGFSLLR